MTDQPFNPGGPIRLTDPMVAYRGYPESYWRHGMPPGAYSLAQLQEWLEEFTYRPNARLRILSRGYGDLTLLVEMRVEDTYNPGQQVNIQHYHVLPPYLDTFERFQDWLGSALERVEIHESREWLKSKKTGRPVRDPHA